MMQQSAHKKKFAASYSLDKILAIPDDEQVEIDNRTGRTMRKIRRVSRRGSDESGNEEGDDQVSCLSLILVDEELPEVWRRAEEAAAGCNASRADAATEFGRRGG